MLAIAEATPQRNFIGIEYARAYAEFAADRLRRHEQTNARLVHAEASWWVRCHVADAALAAVHVYFPDPWPQARHHKRRLIQAPFVSLLASRIAPGGYLHCATDWQEYAEQMLEVLGAEQALQNTADAYAPRPDYRPVTKFENRGLRLGHGVWDLVFVKR